MYSLIIIQDWYTKRLVLVLVIKQALKCFYKLKCIRIFLNHLSVKAKLVICEIFRFNHCHRISFIKKGVADQRLFICGLYVDYYAGKYEIHQDQGYKFSHDDKCLSKDAALSHRVMMPSQEIWSNAAFKVLGIISLFSLYLLYTCKRRASKNCRATTDK